MTTQLTPPSNEETPVSELLNLWGIRVLVNLYLVIYQIDGSRGVTILRNYPSSTIYRGV